MTKFINLGCTLTRKHYFCTCQLERVQKMSLLFDARKCFLLITFSILIWKKIPHRVKIKLYCTYGSILEFIFIFIFMKIENTCTVRGFLLVFSLPPPVGKIHNLAKKGNGFDWFISYYIILVFSEPIVFDFCFKRYSNWMKIGWIIKNFIRNH